jgi:pimeloyl-ACP methyl ester carboxylesterase
MTVAIQTRLFCADGLTVAAAVGGNPQRPAVILSHGAGQTRHSWDRAMRELLEAGYHVINLDARGHGESEWAADADYSMEALARDLRAVIATLPSRPALVGASMGGLASLFLIGGNPEPLASALVLVDVTPRVDKVGASKISAFMRANGGGFVSIDEAADAVSAYNPNRPRPKDVSGLMKNLRRREDGRLYWHWDPKFVTQQRQTTAPQRADMLLKMAGKVTIPTLLVRGMSSDIVSDQGAEEFRQRMPQLEVYEVQGAGHMVAGDKNDAFNDGVIAFLRRHHPCSAS